MTTKITFSFFPDTIRTDEMLPGSYATGNDGELIYRAPGGGVVFHNLSTGDACSHPDVFAAHEPIVPSSVRPLGIGESFTITRTE